MQTFSLPSTLRVKGFAVAAAALVVAAVVAPPSAQATFPGSNGRILFTEFVGEDDAQVAQIFSANPDGSQVEPLSDGTSYDFDPAPTADDTRIAFARKVGGQEQNIWVMDADGGNPTKIVDSGSLDREVSWAPDGSRFAFTTNRSGSFEVFVADADGSDQVKIADGQAPAWSPDGNRIAFARGANELLTVAPDGSDPIVVNIESSSPFPIDWSPNSDRLVYSCDLPEVGNALCLIDPDGTDRTPLDIGPLAANGAVFSPDGNRLLFEGSTADGTGNGIYTMASDGTDVTPVIASGERVLALTAWTHLPLAVEAPPTTTPPSTTPTTSPSATTAPLGPQGATPAQPAAAVDGRPTYTG